MNTEENPEFTEKLKEYDDKINEMTMYDNLHRLQSISDDDDNDQDLSDIASYIHKNYITMDDNEMGHILLRCISNREVRKELLNIEFKHYIPNMKYNLTLNEFSHEARPFLNRFLLTTIGSTFEDVKWTFRNHNSKKYKLNENQIVFDITSKNIPGYNSLIYDLEKILNGICDVIIVKLHIVRRQSTNILAFKCTHTNMEIEEKEISL